MDLSKAFDALPHGLLIAKLNAYGVSKSACKMICSYLHYRKQRVKLPNAKSDWQIVKRGVPQGSVLGPLLFNIFKNDIFYFLDGMCSLYNYADDDTISHSDHDITNLQHKLSKASVTAVKWFHQNGMQANAPKFQVAFFTRAKDLHGIKVSMNDVVLSSQSHVKLLGVTVDGKLTFDRHVAEICKRAGIHVNGLYRLATYLPKESLMKIYVSFVVPNFLYCPLSWHFCSQSNSKKLEKVQERAFRIILNDLDSSYKGMLEKTKSQSLYINRLRLIMIEIFKALNGLTPEFVKELFTPKLQNYELRDDNLLVTPPFQTIRFGKNSLVYYGSFLWNTLGNMYKNAECLDEFKKNIKNWKGPPCACGCCLLCLYG
jgi:hypothetical protein